MYVCVYVFLYFILKKYRKKNPRCIGIVKGEFIENIDFQDKNYIGLTIFNTIHYDNKIIKNKNLKKSSMHRDSKRRVY